MKKSKISGNKRLKKSKPNKKLSKLMNILNYDVNVGKEKEYFVENFAMLISSGIDILTTIDAIESEVKSKQMKQIIAKFRQDIEAGHTIWKAIQKSKLLPKYMVLLLRFGEESGRLDKNLGLIVDQQRKNRILSSKIRSALLYPGLVMSLSVVIGIGITWFILPNLTKVFTNLQMELPLITRIMIWLGKFLGNYGIIVMPASIVLLIGLIYFLFIYRKTKFIGQSAIFKIKAFRELIQNTELAKFGFLLGSLLDAGMPIITALDSIYEITGYVKYRKFYEFLRESINEGLSFQESMFLYPKLNEIIPITVQQLLISSEQSGLLSDVLLKIGNIYDEKIENTSKNLTVLLEPIMLIIIWVGVVFLALAIILPVYSLIGGFNSSPVVDSNNTDKQVSTISNPTPYPTIVLKDNEDNRIEVLDIEEGFLNVLEGPSTSDSILVKIYPKEVYRFIAFEDGWYEIVVTDEVTGWVPKKNVKMLE